MSSHGSPSRDLQPARRSWVEPALNVAVALMLAAPLVVALGWPVIDSILGRF